MTASSIVAGLAGWGAVQIDEKCQVPTLSLATSSEETLKQYVMGNGTENRHTKYG